MLIFLQRGTLTRKTFDRALQALPITQHKELWRLYISWAKDFGVPQTAIKIFRRYLMYDPSYREEYIEYLEELQQYQEAARQLAHCLNDETFTSPMGQTTHQLWMHLCELCALHPKEVADAVNFEALIRTGLTKFSDEVGRLWTSLSDYYIRLGQFEKARDVYEEALRSVSTVRDFTIIFDAYMKVEESIVTAKIRMLHEYGEEELATDEELQAEKAEEEAEVALRLSRIEYLLERRPLLLNAVVLRQNPHNVHEWQKRAKLYQKLGDEAKLLQTYQEAEQTIEPAKAVGKLSTLYLAWANLYEKHLSPANKDVGKARAIYERAITVNFKAVEELVSVYCAFAEFHLRQEAYSSALTLMQRAVDTSSHLSLQRRKAQAVASGKGFESLEESNEANVHEKLFKQPGLWALYLDLEESLGSVTSTRAAYDRAMELKVLTVQMALNYATFLQENHFFEDSFQVYERALSLFAFPASKPLWLAYLAAFTQRYEGTKLERLRDLYEQVLRQESLVEGEDVVEFFVLYAKMEEQYGLARHVTAVYDRAVRHPKLSETQRLDLYRLYVKKVEQHFGVLQSRGVYDQALRSLGDDSVRALCLEYAESERRLGEIDRARAIYQYGSQFADPKRYGGSYWQAWRDFEAAHGSEESFKDLLRVQKSVALAFGQTSYLAEDLLAASKTSAAPTNSFAAAQKVASSSAVAASAMDRLAMQAEAQIAEELEEEGGDVAGLKRKFFGRDSAEGDEETEDGVRKMPRTSQPAVENREEIDI